MKQYTITSDCRHFIVLSDRTLAERLANEIRGGVYITHHDEMVLIYSYLDNE